MPRQNACVRRLSHTQSEQYAVECGIELHGPRRGEGRADAAATGWVMVQRKEERIKGVERGKLVCSGDSGAM